MKSQIKTIKLNNEQKHLVFSFFIAAYKDYISARILLNENQLSQGCILALTALEKYFKAMKVIMNESVPKHHDITVRKFLNSLKNNFPRLFKKVNLEFINLLSDVYVLRYLDDVPEGYNIVLINRKVLAELDYTINEIEVSFDIRDAKNNLLERGYQSALKRKEDKLLQNNYIALNLDKTSYIEQDSLVYEMRKMPNKEIMEVFYITDKIKNDNIFKYDALVPTGGFPTSSFSFAFIPKNKI